MLNCFQNDVVHIRICVHLKATFERQGYFLEKRGLVPQETVVRVGGRFNKITGFTN